MAYIKEAFYPSSIQHAMDICLTPDSSNPNKFHDETKFLVDFLADQKLVNGATQIADFGCGVGRVSKGLINTHGCNIVGFDISMPMLTAAVVYVDDARFTPQVYNTAVPYTKQGTFDLVIASLVLQHSENPIRDIRFIRTILKDKGTLVLINEKHRYVPVGVDDRSYVIWKDDGIDVFDEVSKQFSLVSEHQYYNRTDNALTLWKK